MGGGARFEFPRYVWSPTGGWWPEPKMWKRNTLLAGAFIVAACIPVYNLSKRLEVRPEKLPVIPAHLMPPPGAADGSHH
ncbi:hypothetical protein CAOG_06483 [Capsaspora owczarzaki ATCC 30864]|uniref:hypothetical protein n=1 Tax=Capsaspora owczarzaki (strain ATCC 30864) TaxID=595528 RepID=UPI0001FE37FA|nr:hypothetical protein CAOG_06483 [Capsaspora owczarzaki ATCC 30864]|eukprot:XP_004345232.1 hypothetical protein CAOG_06483 [Capsaspora owczarzaki ATCC 30864]